MAEVNEDEALRTVASLHTLTACRITRSSSPTLPVHSSPNTPFVSMSKNSDMKFVVNYCAN